MTHDGQRYLAHQVVLASRSRRLHDLFLEKRSAYVEVHLPCKVSVTAMESFLKYVYTNSFMSGHAYTNNLTDVLFLAYYYEVEDLFRTCGLEILKTLSDETVVDTIGMLRSLHRWGGETRSSMALDYLSTELTKYLQRDGSMLAALVKGMLRPSAFHA